MISVPTPQLTDEQKAQQEEERQKGDQMNAALDEHVPKLEQEMDEARQEAQRLQHGGTKEEYNALADKLQKIQNDADTAQAVFDSAGIPNSQYSYHQIGNMRDYASLAEHDARQAGEAAGDNEEVRGVAHGNMQNNLDHIPEKLH
jgi:hypothetical protein